MFGLIARLRRVTAVAQRSQKPAVTDQFSRIDSFSET